MREVEPLQVQQAVRFGPGELQRGGGEDEGGAEPGLLGDGAEVVEDVGLDVGDLAGGG